MVSKIEEIKGIGLYLDLVLRKIQDSYMQKFEELGVSMTIEQWVIMHQIYELGDEASQSDIVKLNFRNRATVSRVIGGMQRKGWINKTRFKGDQKRYKLELTPEGAKIFKKVIPHAKQLRELEVKDITKADFETFLNVLDKIGENYKDF